jgi:hypothetical protein
MSAFPFGGHPTFGAYVSWAAGAGCTIRTGYKRFPDGEVLSMTKITAPSGKSVVQVDLAQDERLVPTLISYMDRRLDLESPWSFQI